MAITPEDRKISQMTEVAPSVGMYVPLVDLTLLPPAQNVRASVGAILALVNLSGYVPTSRAVNTSGSLTGGGDLSANRTLSLVGDSLAPGNSYYYGTDGSGTKGFFVLPAAGTGTVTSFSSGNLSPLFTTNVASATTTPTQSFSLSTQSANLVFAGPTNGAAAAPTFRSLVAADIPSLSSVYQPLNANLTAISLLTTTSYGLGFLEIANAAAARTYIGAGTGSGTVGPGTTNQLAKFTASTTVGDSLFSDNGSVGLVQSSATGGASTFAIQNTAAAGLSNIEFRNNSGTVRSTFGYGNASASAPLNGSMFLFTASGVDFIFYTNANDAGRITSTRNFLWGTSTDTGGSGNMSVGGALTLGTALSRQNGGTGFTSYAEGDLIYGNAGGGLSKLAIQTLPGYVLSSGATPSWIQLSTLTATTITGTANQVLVNGTSGSGVTGAVTLTTPQSIATTSTPQFAGLGIGVPAVANTPLWSEVNYDGLAFHINRNTSTGASARATNLVWSDNAQILFQTFGSGNTGNIYGITAADAAEFRSESASTMFISSGNTAPIVFGINGSQVGRITTTGLNSMAVGATTPSTGAFTTLTVNSKAVSEGAADSGGTGFRVLRVPN